MNIMFWLEIKVDKLGYMTLENLKNVLQKIPQVIIEYIRPPSDGGLMIPQETFVRFLWKRSVSFFFLPFAFCLLS